MSYQVRPQILESTITDLEALNLEQLFLRVRSLPEGRTTSMRSRTDCSFTAYSMYWDIRLNNTGHAL